MQTSTLRNSPSKASSSTILTQISWQLRTHSHWWWMGPFLVMIQTRMIRLCCSIQNSTMIIIIYHIFILRCSSRCNSNINLHHNMINRINKTVNTNLSNNNNTLSILGKTSSKKLVKNWVVKEWHNIQMVMGLGIVMPKLSLEYI